MQGFGNSGGIGGRSAATNFNAFKEAESNGANKNTTFPRSLRGTSASYIDGLAMFSPPGAGLSEYEYGAMHGTSIDMTNTDTRGGSVHHQRGFTNLIPALQSRLNENSTFDAGAARYQVPQRRNNEPFPRPDSSLSNGTFATQADHSLTTHDRSDSELNGRSLYETIRGQRCYQMPYMQNTNGALANTLDNRLSRMNVNGDEFKMPAGRALPAISEANSNGHQNGHVNGNRTSDRSRNDSLVSVGHTPSAFVLAQTIKAGLTEDPYDRTLNRLDTPAKLHNPTLGPARFKDSKMFSTIDDIDSSSSEAPSANNTSYAIARAAAFYIPDWLQLALEGNMVPTLEEAFDALPLMELCRTVSASSAGVVRIKDIPYGTTRQEMIAFVGRNAQIMRQPEGSPYHAVHILMERESGKTMDCFLEVTNANEAAWVVRQFAKRVEQHRPPKVGDRVVEVLYSSQDELMAELFPRAKHVRWSHGKPSVDKAPRKYYENQEAAGFQGFLHPEELVAMGKHANLSDRSPFASKSPCRVYEAMITLLYKYPWSSPQHISISERRGIFDCAVGLLKTLINDLRRGNNRPNPLQPTVPLLQELAVSMLCCPGFSEKQKATIVGQLCQGGYKSIAEGQGINVKLGGRHELSSTWPFSALSMTPDADTRLLQYYSTLFRQATSKPGVASLADRQAAKAAGLEDKPMGNIKVNYGNNAKNLSLAEVAKLEYDEIEKMLERVLHRTPAFGHGFSAPDLRSNSRGAGSNGSSSRSGSGSAHSMPFM